MISPYLLMQCWGPWVVDCLRLMDGDGAYAHWPYPGAYMEQPAFDMGIYDAIRSRWVELRNAELKRGK